MKFSSFFLACALSAHALPILPADSWTWLYKKAFTEDELRDHEHQKSIIFSKEDLAHFTQLMPSWNAFRPAQGYYCFWIQVKDAATQQWTEWHKMMEWGAGVQRSFSSTRTGKPRHEHVRFEMGNRAADAFRIKVYAHDGASLSQLKAIFVAISDFRKFKPEDTQMTGAMLSSLVIPNVPKKSQFMVNHPKNNSICSPTSCSMLVSYLLGQEIDPYDFAEKAFDHGLNAYGSWPFNMAHAFERCGGTMLFAAARLNSFAHLYQRLQQGIPVVVSVRGYLEGAPKVYAHGHLLVVVGFDAEQQQVICHDPAFETDALTLKHYNFASFVNAWEASNRLSYLAELSRV